MLVPHESGSVQREHFQQIPDEQPIMKMPVRAR
jgi:hypothetical protein